MLVCSQVSRRGLRPTTMLLQAAFVAAGTRGSECFPEQSRSTLLPSSFWEHEWAGGCCQIRTVWVAGREIREWRRGATPIPEGFYWRNASLCTVIFSMICVPWRWANWSRREFLPSRRVVMQTQGVFTLRFAGSEGDIGGTCGLL